MKATLSVVCSLTLLAATGAAQAQPVTAAVVPLLHDRQVSDREAAQVRQAVRSALQSAGRAPLSAAETDRQLVATDITCASTKCMASAAATLKVGQLVGGRLERSKSGQGLDHWTLSLWLYDASAKATAATTVGRCEACAAVQLMVTAVDATRRLLEQAGRNQGGRIDVGSVPRGAIVTIDGVARGVTNMPFGVKPGAHTVVLRLQGFEQSSHQVQVKPGGTAVIKAHLDPVVADAGGGSGASGAPRVLKWVTLGAAVASLGAGVALLVMDGEPTCDTERDHYVCPERYETLTPGIALLAAGAALGGTSGLLFYLDSREAAQSEQAAATPRTLSVTPVVSRQGGGVSALLTF